MQEKEPFYDVQVVIMDNVTIVEGSDTVYRYDLSTEGILDGWALPALMEQIKVVGPPSFPMCEVSVDGITSACAKVVAALREQGVSVTSLAAPPARELELGTQVDYRPKSQRGDRPKFYRIAVAAVLVVVAGCGLWTVWKTSPSDSDVRGVATEKPAASSALTSPSRGPAPRKQAVPTRLAPAEVPGLAGVRAVIPEGFAQRGTAPEGMVSFEAPSGDLRVHLHRETAADTLPAAIIDQINTDVSMASDMTPSARPGLVEGPETAYIEEPGDGSVVLWFVWAEGTDVLSLGCHTRIAPTLAQRATCRSIAEGMTIVGEAGTAAMGS